MPALCLVALEPARSNAKRETAAVASDIGSFAVSGAGAPRDSQDDCERDIHDFEKALSEKGFSLVSAIKCEPLAGVGTQYVPKFHALSKDAVAITSVSGLPFNSLSYCHL